MEGNTDFKVSATPRTTIFEVELNVSEFYDLHCEPGGGGGATGITGTFGHVPAGEHRIGLKVTSVPKGISGYIQLPEGGGWVVFNWTNSTAYPGTEIVNVSWTWNVTGIPPCSGFEPFSRVIDRDTTATPTVV